MPDHVHMCLGIAPKYRCCEHDREAEGEVDDNAASKVWKEAQFHRLKFWSRGYLREHGGSG